jgi:8-oxo-dGTP pyrophosphatase MutT (NUDIX family)
MSDDPRWKILSTEKLLTTPYYEVVRDRLLHPAGRELDYFVVRHRRHGAGIVAVRDDSVLLVQQWRHTVQKLLWEIPAGAVDDGETPDQAAARELREETGFNAKRVTPLQSYHPMIGTSRSTFHLFIGEELDQIGEPLPGETIALKWVPRAEIERMLDAGEVVDGMSLTALLLWLRRPR